MNEIRRIQQLAGIVNEGAEMFAGMTDEEVEAEYRKRQAEEKSLNDEYKKLMRLRNDFRDGKIKVCGISFPQDRYPSAHVINSLSNDDPLYKALELYKKIKDQEQELLMRAHSYVDKEVDGVSLRDVREEYAKRVSAKRPKTNPPSDQMGYGSGHYQGD